MKVSKKVRLWQEYELGQRIAGEKPLENIDLEWERIERENELLRWADEEVMNRADDSFYRSAIQYSDSSWEKNTLVKARILARYYDKFNYYGKQALVDRHGGLSKEVMSKERPGMYVGKIFYEVYEGVKNRINRKKR